ncbi:polysaccharide deacetylase family protein [Pseudarthrobacter sp. S9]|uniref:polysaccharide deacetylase family protein n=1 Tax=Pseudarthrobacter sp. S9 TaxID=3418421 RepID=UPI003D033054
MFIITIPFRGGMMLGRRFFRNIAIILAVIGLAIAPTASPAAVDPMPPLPQLSWITAAEQYNILHLYYLGPKVRLTFDDCATQARLTGILDWLRANDIQATFFFTGQCMLAHPGYGEQLINAGQLLGNHSYDHGDYSRMTAAQIGYEVRRYGSVVPTTSPKLCRPPYGAGAFSVGVYDALAAAGCRPAFWTVDTRDWDGSSAATIIQRVKYGDATTPRVYAGGVILMHGTGLHTLEALPGVRSALIYRGYATFHIH